MYLRITIRLFTLCFFVGIIGTYVSNAQNQTIGGDLTGEPLLEYLRSNYTPNTTLGYNRARDRMYTILDNEDGYVIGVYTYYQVPVDPNSTSPRADAYQGGSGMNAEHIWPQSKGADSGPPNSDLHHLYSTEIRVNSDRGNLRFGTIPDEEVDLWYNKEVKENTGNIFTSSPPAESDRHFYSKRKNGDRFEVKLDRKGDVARAIFYFYTIYRDVADSDGPGFFESMDEAMREWHSLDEVDNYEVWRSESIGEWQGNVNPFVMDTTLVRRAFFMEDGGNNPDPDSVLTELFTETFGTVSSSTEISEHAFDNADFTFEGNGDIRESLPSEGYEDASGSAQVFMNLGYRYITIGNINTLGFEELELSFGNYSSSTTPLLIEYRTDSDALWTELTYNEQLSSDSWSRITIEESGLPAVETLEIRFSKDNDQQYRLDDIHLSGVESEATSLDRDAGIPGTISLGQNYPNPFNPSTVIKFDLPENQRVKLAVYDMLGREVAVLLDGMRSAGSYDVRWNASGMSSGIYMYSLQTESSRMTRKMTLMK